jgi:hypothetical protein
LLASKLPVKAGALLTPRKLNSRSEFIQRRVSSEIKKDRIAVFFNLRNSLCTGVRKLS